MKVAYFDLIGGASGDMILGALLDAGLPEAQLRQELDRLHLPDFDLSMRRVNKNGFSAVKVDVLVKDDVPERRLAEIEAIMEAADLPDPVSAAARSIFRRMAEEEARIHGLPVDQVHLHELGGVDTIVDVCGALLALRLLEVEAVYASPVPLGGGFAKGAHGIFPLPAPASVALLKGALIAGRAAETELVTPTGAALLTHLSQGFGPIPPMRLSAVGYGAGGRDTPIPNLLRVLIGDLEPRPADGRLVETLVSLETNVDDLNPEFYDHLLRRLFNAGALDVTLAPVQMKKNRPASLISVLCRPAHAGELSNILFAETSTLGLRRQLVDRISLPRRVETVETPFGPVHVKVAGLGDGRSKAAPEYEDCRLLAERCAVPLREVYQSALAAFSLKEEAQPGDVN